MGKKWNKIKSKNLRSEHIPKEVWLDLKAGLYWWTKFIL